MNIAAYCRVSTDKEDQMNSLEAHIALLKSELLELYDIYDSSYNELTANVQENTARTRYFSGSDEMLCIYEPSLINRLQCKWCLKGSFKDKKPRSKTYHSIAFNVDNNPIKIDFYDDAAAYQEHKEIFIIYKENAALYLIYNKAKQAQAEQLCEIYLLKYNDSGRLAEYVNIPSRALSRDLKGEIYNYSKHNLVDAIKYSTWYSEYFKYEFEYNENGYMNCYKRYDITGKNPTIYGAKFSISDIEHFEKYKRFHFSPIEN